MTGPARRRLRIAAYVVCQDADDRLLLARWVSPDGYQWTLPGGGLDYGEHPEVGALRELREETGYAGALDALLAVDTDHFIGGDGTDWHSVRVIYRGRVVGGELTHEVGGSTDLAAWVPAAEVAGLDAVALVGAGVAAARTPGAALVARLSGSAQPAEDRPHRARLAAYALVRDAAGAVLLVRGGSSSRTPGRWFLPGGTVEHGEPVDAAVEREVAEETGLDVRATGLRAVTSDVQNVELGGVPVSLWTVRVVWDAVVVGGEPAAARAPDGVDAVSWAAPGDLADLDLVDEVRAFLDQVP